jgi:hypothetical protein
LGYERDLLGVRVLDNGPYGANPARAFDSSNDKPARESVSTNELADASDLHLDCGLRPGFESGH